MRLIEMDCPRCAGNIVFEVYDLNDSPSGERFASFVEHKRPEWHCPYQWHELRQERREFQQLREDVLTV